MFTFIVILLTSGSCHIQRVKVVDELYTRILDYRILLTKNIRKRGKMFAELQKFQKYRHTVIKCVLINNNILSISEAHITICI